MKRLLIAALALVLGSSSTETRNSLEIYFIDVEGGQSTLIITPDRHSLLIDAGFPADGSDFRPGDPHLARDANRIVAAARDAGVKQIDYLLITHFHPDHYGGVPELAQLIPIHTYIDHGSPDLEVLKDSIDAHLFAVYLNARERHVHLEPHPGDRLPIPDVEATVVSSAGATLTTALPDGRGVNATCEHRAPPAADSHENPRSTGIVIRYGNFRFLDVGDLSGDPLFNLVCPKDLIGPVDAYLVAHHGGPDIGYAATFAAWKPRVAIMNNGVTKGGYRVTYEALHRVAGLQDVWQLHASADAGDENFSAARIANLDQSTANWIKLVANSDGSFRVVNPRTGDSKSYPRRSP